MGAVRGSGPVARRRTWLVAALLVPSLLAGCGSDDTGAGTEPGQEPSAAVTPSESPSGSPSESPSEPADEPTASAPTEPVCADVWVEGARLPRPYRGCHDAERGVWVKAKVIPCSTGQRIVTFADSFYAAGGRPVVRVEGPLVDDARFSQAVAACTA